MGQLISQFDEDPNTETHHTTWPDYSNWGEFREMKHHVWLPEQDREARQNYKGTWIFQSLVDVKGFELDSVGSS